MKRIKAQGLSMTTIVIAALSLLVLVVLVLIFTGRMSLFSGGVEESSKCANYCTSMNKDALTSLDNSVDGKTKCREDNKGDVIPAITGDDKGKICCCYKKS